MGKLLPEFGNITFSGAGELAPLINDPDFETIGIGTKIFLCGASGHIIGPGTQPSPETGFSTLMISGNLKEMSPEWLKAAIFEGYGCSLYIGIGLAIPILNERLTQKTGIADEEIYTNVIDYCIPNRNRPILKRASYAELKSGYVEIEGKKVKTSPLSSLFFARRIAKHLKEEIKKGEYFLVEPVERISLKGSAQPLPERKAQIRIKLKRPPAVSPSEKLVKDDSKCLHCGLCLSLCSFGVFFRDDTWRILANPLDCQSYEVGVEAYPVKASNAYLK